MHSLKVEEVFKSTKSTKQGLEIDEAKQRLAQNGLNELQHKKKQSKIVLFLKQFCDVMIIVLCVAAAISLCIGIATKSRSELLDAIIVLAIVFLNAIIGFIQEVKAEKGAQTLKDKSEHYSKVYRDGKLLKIKSKEVVVGDVVLLESGDLVPADIRLFEVNHLSINEANLTGESMPSKKNISPCPKDTPMADRDNIAYSGGVVESGRGLGVVFATGMQTKMGAIAKNLNEAKVEETLLQKKLNKTAKIITAICLGISGIIFVASLLLKMGFLPAFMTSVAIAVAAIPEGLPAIITIIMAIGMQRLSKKQAIIKRLRAVETLGCTQVICSDKTGTLTQNKLAVRGEFLFDEESVLMIAKHCNNASIDNQKIGTSVEIALLEYVKEKKIKPMTAQRLDEIPFDSTRKKMSVLCKVGYEKMLFTKGAPDVVLKDCEYYSENGKIMPLTAFNKEAILNKIKEFGDNAYKVLGFAFKKTEEPKASEEKLVFAGLLALIDPPRPEVKAAILKCEKAGIKTVMITGDHKSTATAIAKGLGICTSEKEVLTGQELDVLSDDELLSKINDLSVFARVSPEHKVRIVKTFKKAGKVVAMTGDGVNDAPSLKEANIGIGMGKGGTEVAKEASDIILVNDNFSAIVSSVEEGRKIYSNITKTIVFLLSANIAEMLSLLLLTLFVAPFYAGFVFLIPAQILFVNLITDALPAIALGVEPLEKDAMKKPPRKEQAHLLSGRVGFNIIYQGILQTLIVVGVFLFGLNKFGNQAASTMALITLNFIQLFHCFNSKSEDQSIFKIGLKNNKLMLLSFFLGASFTILITTVPLFKSVFGLATLTPMGWFISLFSAFLIVPAVEVVKIFQRKKNG